MILPGIRSVVAKLLMCKLVPPLKGSAMKKVLYSLMVTMATLLGFGTVASAYPPDSTPSSTVDPNVELPVTGSGDVSGLVFVAIILVAVGVGLFVTAQARRRNELGA